MRNSPSTTWTSENSADLIDFAHSNPVSAAIEPWVHARAFFAPPALDAPHGMTDFSELGLSPPTLQAVADTGYLTATPIQAQAIPVALAGRDVLGIAQTGTGKTAAFTLPMIDRLTAGRSKARMPRSLVIAPTRELADQVAAAFDRYSKGQKLTWALLIGGVSFGDQEMKLDRGVDVLIATPGRLLDHFERGKLLLTGVQIMVVDEADRMLDMGFIPDIERIFKLTPAKKQTLFFSATMPPEITRLTKQFLTDPVRIEASRPATTGENISQFILRVPQADPGAKRLALRTLVGASDVKNGIVFCNRKSEVDIVAKSLRSHGFDASPIHGDLDQSMRMKTLDAFRKGELKLLVASDVAARGLDIPDVSHVFNYDVPHHADDYVHRIGRTGRAGKSGSTYMLVTPADGRQLDKVLKLTGKAPTEVSPEIDYSGVRSEPRREKPQRGPERDRDRSRGRPASETSVAAMAPLTPTAREAGPAAPPPIPAAPAPVERVAAAPARAARESAPKHRADRPERAPRAAATAEAEARERDRRHGEGRRPGSKGHSRDDEAPRRSESKPAPRDDDDRHVVRGFGADLPAFLARPVSVPPIET
jgi:superfamily II DNA/RNA helicase